MKYYVFMLVFFFGFTALSNDKKNVIQCESQTDSMIHQITDLSKMKNRNEAFCSQAFDIGSELIGFQISVTGAGWGGVKPSDTLQSCLDNMSNEFYTRVKKLRVKKICQPIVNNHLIPCDSGEMGDDWIDENFLGTRAFGINLGDICVFK